MTESSHHLFLSDVRSQLTSTNTWLAGGLPQDAMLASMQLDQAADAVGAHLLTGSPEVLDTSAAQVNLVPQIFCNTEGC